MGKTEGDGKQVFSMSGNGRPAGPWVPPGQAWVSGVTCVVPSLLGV